MKRDFWLLDLNYETRNGKPAVWLWGITHEQRRVLIIDSDYQPYFYVLPRKDQNPTQLKEKLELERPHPSIDRVTIEKRKHLADDHLVLKVFCKEADTLEKCAKQTAKFLGAARIFEEDLRFSIKYQNDLGIKPCQWYEIETDESSIEPLKYGVDEVLQAKAHPSPIPKEDPPSLRMLGFSILSIGQTGSPSPLRDPVRVIAWTNSKGDKDVLQSPGDSDKEILEDFSEEISRFNPDIVFSFGGNRLQWPYMVKRAEKTEARLFVGRDAGPPRQSLYGHFSLTGRANIDLADFSGELYDVKVKTLENVARYLGIPSAKSSPVDESEYFAYWTSPDRRRSLVDKIRAEAETTLNIGKDALDYIIQLSSLSGLPPDQVLAAAVGFRVDSYMMIEAHKLGQLIPSRKEQPVIPYKGALVLQPQVGLHENVAALDFSSMYPKLMIKYNISPDSYLDDGRGEEAYEIPEVGYRFRKKPPGFYTTVLTSLLQNRQEAKKEMARVQRGTPKHRLLKARERATKVTTNAVYGYAGWIGSRWYFREVAESAAALGRDTINRSISIVERLGLRVLYGDTDSLFLEYDKRLVDEFLHTIEEELGLEINISQVYRRLLFTEAKKKYAGLTEGGELDVVGMEAIRGDWSDIAKNVQEKVLEYILKDAEASRATSYVANLARDLKSARVPLSSLVIWKTLTKHPDQYEVRAPHSEVAKKLIKDGWTVSANDKIGYIITNKAGKLFQKAEPYFKVSPEDVDYDYYLENQVLPVAVRVLKIFGVTEKDLLESPGLQRRLLAGAEGE